MESISLLIKPTSDSCNMKCSYCFYKDLKEVGDTGNKGFMTEATMKNLIDNVFIDLSFNATVQFDFQGGEPSLMGIDFYKEFVNYVNTINTSNITVGYSFQTNGLLIDEKWAKFFKKNNFLLGLSLDGFKDINDKYRLRLDGGGSYNRIMRAKKILDKEKVAYNVLAVLTRDAANEPELMWDFLIKEDIRYIQFIPCLDSIDHKSENAYSLSPEKFSKFYKTIFSLWKDSLYKGEYYSIGLIDEIMNLADGNQNISCAVNGVCKPQYVIEADGSIYPCDFYVLEKYNLGNININRIEEVFYKGNMRTFLEEKAKTVEICKTCQYKHICNGGCKRLKRNMYLNKDENFCGYRSFLDSSLTDISTIVKALKDN